MPPARIVFWASTLAGIVFSIRSAVIGPPALPIAVACALVYVTILLCGVFFLKLRMFVDAVVHGGAGARGVVLTFDDGPDPEHTPEVLSILEKHGAKATFFVIGRKAEKHPELVREILARGHAVGVHSWAHDRLFSLRGASRVRTDLARAKKSLEAITGQPATLFRPPIGHTNPTIAREADLMGFETIGWSVAARDGLASTTPADVIARIAPGLEDGAIVLLHDAPERGTRRPAGVVALSAILDRIASKGLEVAHLPDWLREDEEPSAEAAR